MFELLSEWDLIDVMGEATRDESTAIAQRLAAWRSCMCAGLVTWPINQERRERTELIAEEERQRQAWLAANYEPPPF